MDNDGHQPITKGHPSDLKLAMQFSRKQEAQEP